jgi:hypothetical protein
MTQNNDPQDELQRRLQRHAGSVDIPVVPVQSAIRRGHQRQHRRRTATGMLAVAGVSVGVMGAVQVLSRPEPSRRLAGAPAADVPVGTDGVASSMVPGTVAPAFVTEVPSNFVWNAITPGSAEAVGIMPSGMVGDGPYLAWSTKPARSDGVEQGMLWRSDDGASWRQAVQPPVTGGSLAAYDGRFFTFGTTPAANGSVQAMVAFSADAGDTWSTASLPIDTAALEADPAVRSVEVMTVGLAAGPAGVLLVARVTPQLDWTTLLPAEDLNRGITITPAGVEVLATGPCDAPTPSTTIVTGPSAAPDATTATTIVEGTTDPTSTISNPPTTDEGCLASPVPARTYTWAELGISQAVGDAFDGSLRYFLSTTGGSTFEEVTGPAVASQFADVRLTATADGFAAWTAVYGPEPDVAMWNSADGLSWTELDAPPVAYAESLLAWGDRLVITGQDDNGGGTIVAVRGPSGGWTATNLAGLVRPSDGVSATIGASGAVVGPLGISLIGWLSVDPIAEVGGVEMTRDGITVRAEKGDGNYTFLDTATGEELGRVQGGRGTTELVTGGYDSPIVVRLTADAPPVSFSWEDLSKMFEPILRNVSSSTSLLLHSTDGVSWSRDSLDEAAGEPVNASGGLRVVGSQLVVATLRPSDGSTLPQQLLVATPRS